MKFTAQPHYPKPGLMVWLLRVNGAFLGFWSEAYAGPLPSEYTVIQEPLNAQ